MKATFRARLCVKDTVGYGVSVRVCCAGPGRNGSGSPRQQTQTDVSLYTTMEYMLLVYADAATFISMTSEARDQALAGYHAYTEALEKAGVLRGSNRLRPVEAATTVRVKNGRTEVLNGPYAETREQLGGYYLIDVKDLDAALSWAARCPGASHGVVEVRFEVEGCKGCEIDGLRLERVTATGIAVRFAQAA